MADPLPGTPPTLRETVAIVRAGLAERRAKARAQHDAGSPGIQVCAQLTDSLDWALLKLYETATEGLKDVARHVALVAHGGYGRRDVAPFSDVDLMLLHPPALSGQMGELARRLTHAVYDTGLQLGFSVRTPRQACRLSMEDATIFTSLVESRFLAGSVGLFQRFARQFRKTTRRHQRTLINAVEAARDDEKGRFGDTVYLLAPNLKRSRGGLREVQMVRWIGFAVYGEANPEALERIGALMRTDRRRLRRGHEFLLRLRNEMHFHAGKAQDVLNMGEQVRLAQWLEFQERDGLLPVERFMREYFEHTGEIRFRVRHFVDGVKQGSKALRLLGRFFSRRTDEVYFVGPIHIRAGKRGLELLKNDLAEVLRLMDLANSFDKRIDHDTWNAIREDMVAVGAIEVTPQAAERFLSLLKRTARLANLLRRLHQLRALEKLVPGMAHARCLLQFNEYHKYTVDEHSLRAVQCVTSFMQDDGPLGRAYRQIPDKSILHLAVLIHDMGKGFPEDHSEVGRRLALETAAHLGLPEEDAETLAFLVHKHLLMAHTAFRHNLNDESVIVRFAREVGRLDRLRMLYVLTCADLAAVGPGVLNPWKLDLLTQLYRRTRQRLASDSEAFGDHDESVIRKRAAIADCVGELDAWWRRQLDTLPVAYLMQNSAERIAEELGRIHQLPAHQARAWAAYVPARKAIEYTVAAQSELTPGTFHRLTGALSSKGHQILSAEIHTLGEGMVLDRFFVHDMDFQGRPPESRLEEVCQALTDSLERAESTIPVFRRVWKSRTHAAPDELKNQPARVEFDNSTSDRYTILSVFAYDRLGLLYAITRTLFDAGLSVQFAKIATHLDQVVDVFYVTDRNGGQLTDPARLEQLREDLFVAIDQRKSS